MAKLYPEYNLILKESPSEAEIRIIELIKNFDDSFELFYKPFLNGDIPNFVLLKKNYGIFIIEIFSDNITKFNVEKKFLIKEENKNKIELLSPFAKVDLLKNHIINLHFKELFEKILKDYHYRKIINSVVYFHNTNSDEFENWYQFQLTQNKTWKLFDSQIITNDTLTNERFDRLLLINGIQNQSKYFDDELYNNLFRYLKPSFHRIDDGIFINFSEEQIKILRNPNNAKLRKIRGVAGSGKTLLLAKMAVDELVKTRSKVLILTYNLALKNYITEQINRIQEEFLWDDFEIRNYHDFFKSKALEYNLPIKFLSDFDNKYFFDRKKDEIKKYKTILIDEIQDYKEFWLEIIKNYFLEDGGTYIVFGDEKQNIYDRPLNEEDDKRLYTGVPGKYWNILEETTRLSNAIRDLAQQFQEIYLGNKYKKDIIKQTSLPLDFANSYGSLINTINYELLSSETNDIFHLYKLIHNKVRELNINPHDVAILGSRVEYIRDLAFLFESIDNEKTTIMSETKEEWWKLLFSLEPVIPLANKSERFFKPIFNLCPNLIKLRSLTKNDNELYKKLKENYIKKIRNNNLQNKIELNEFDKVINDYEFTEHLIVQ